MRITPLIQEELENCGFPFRLERGTRHWKIFVADTFCGILPSSGDSPNRRAALNVRSQIRRQVQRLKNGTALAGK